MVNSNVESLKSISSDDKIPDEEIKLFLEAFELINSMKMHLKANKSESYYWGDNIIHNDGNAMAFSMAKTMIGNDEKYLTKLKEGVTYKQVDAFGETFLIRDSINTSEWKFTKETKKIANYICYKATTSYIVANMVGNFKKNVVAWYCPNIPYNYGPKNFSGLPGLIMELEDDKLTYVLEKIKFSSKDVKIDLLKKGKIISNYEFQGLAAKAIESRGFVLKKE